jgi:hypothetical protein
MENQTIPLEISGGFSKGDSRGKESAKRGTSRLEPLQTSLSTKTDGSLVNKMVTQKSLKPT